MQHKIAFDTDLMRPGCVLLQASMGGNAALAHEFPLESWLLHPTPGLHLYPISDERLPVLVSMVKTRMARPESLKRPEELL